VRDDDDKGREQSFPSEEAEVEGLADEPCTDCHGARLNAVARGVPSRTARSRELAALSVGGAARWMHALALDGRDAEIARDVVVEILSRLEFLEAEVGLGYLTLDRAAPTLSRAARRSASAWPRSSAATCRACATCWTSRPSACTRATTACCSTRWPSCATRATRWWWWSTTRTPSAAPTT
jgi:excinuclease ABC subunit A